MHVELYYERGFYRFIMVTPVRLLRIITWLFRRLLFLFLSFFFLLILNDSFAHLVPVPRFGLRFFRFSIWSVLWRVNSYIRLLTLCSTIEL